MSSPITKVERLASCLSELSLYEQKLEGDTASPSGRLYVAGGRRGKKYRITHQQQGRRYVALRDVIADKAKNLFRRNGLHLER